MSNNSANGSTYRWRQRRAEKLKLNPTCEWWTSRKLEGGVVDGTWCGKPAVEVDHIVPLKDGGPRYEWSNLRSLCADHHKIRHGKRPRPTIDPATGWAD